LADCFVLLKDLDNEFNFAPEGDALLYYNVHLICLEAELVEKATLGGAIVKTGPHHDGFHYQTDRESFFWAEWEHLDGVLEFLYIDIEAIFA